MGLLFSSHHRRHHQQLLAAAASGFFVFLALSNCVVDAATGTTKSDDDTVSFDQNYYITWGNDRVLSLNEGREIQLSMDTSSGSGFASKLTYGSGFFHMNLKLPAKDSAGVVTAFYLTSQGGKHDELDFEFLGNREGKPITLQTNVFADGVGNREQRLHLWFDPTAAFHSYKILWNPHQIVFYIDDVPIRVFKNCQSLGVGYPWRPMQIEASLWNGESWATDGGQAKINWTHAPFKAQFQAFGINGCPLPNTTEDLQHCHHQSSQSWWNFQKFWKLDSAQQRKYDNVRKNYMYYDYCSDRTRYPDLPKECLH